MRRRLSSWSLFLLAGFWVLAGVGFMPAVCGAGRNGEPSVHLDVERENVSLGEPFTMEIQVEGSEGKVGSAVPDVSGLTDFSVEYLGVQDNSRSSITIVNGQMNRVESYGYTYSYRLTAKKVGDAVIPSLAVPLDAKGAKVLHTEPITIHVSEPETSDDFQLELRYSKTKFYVGEPIELTVTWYMGSDVENVSFNIPVLEDSRFAFSDPKGDRDPHKQYYQLPFTSGTVFAERGKKELNGRMYTTLSFRKVLFARDAGNFEIPEATVACKAVTGYSRPQKRNDPFGNFFDDGFFQPGRRRVTKTFVASSGPVALEVMALPEGGKPANFSGCVGQFRVESSATPTDVAVGDPITLTVAISGSDYLDRVELPPLSRVPAIDKDFKVPEEAAAGVVSSGAKVFTQTLRAKSDAVKAIPPVEFSYFDPDRSEYQVARSRPIAIQVKPAHVVTAADAEGRAPSAPAKSELEAWSRGIAYNYEGPDLLENRSFGLATLLRSPLWLAALFLPLCIYLALWIGVSLRRKQTSDPERLRARNALRGFEKRLKPLGSGESQAESYARLLDAIRSYFGDKLSIEGAALTFADLEPQLEARRVDGAILRRIGELFEVCEQGRYGGGLGAGKPFSDLIESARDLIRTTDRVLK